MKPLKVLLPELHPAQLKVLERALLGVIGDDATKENMEASGWNKMMRMQGRNELRAEQRHNLKVLIYGGEK